MASIHNSHDKKIRVLLVCDLPIAAWGLERLIAAHQSVLAFVGCVRTITDAQQWLSNNAVDVILFDLDGGNELVLVADVLEGCQGKVLVISSSHAPTLAHDAVLAGANGLVSKSEAVDVLIKAIEKVHEGEFWVDRMVTVQIFMTIARNKAAADPEREKIARLTRKEKLTIAEIMRDSNASTTEISLRLHISEHTLRNHLTSIYSKLGVTNRVGLFDYATRNILARTPGPDIS
ncbi:MAG: response regulator transcription factor [Pseudomonadota bacterium]